MLKYRTMVWKPNANDRGSFVPEHWETTKEGELPRGTGQLDAAEEMLRNLKPGEALGFWIDPAS